LEGLEINEIKFTTLSQLKTFRFDSEYFKKEYFVIEKKIKNKKYKYLKDIECEIIHPKEIKRNYVTNKNGCWFLRAQNIRPLKIVHSNDVFISKENAKQLQKNKIKKYDVLITRTGANYGQTAFYNVDDSAIASSHILILRNKYFNQAFLAVFFNTIYGRKLIDKSMYGGLQPEIAPHYLLNIPIPEFSSFFQKKIEELLLLSEIKHKQVKQLYNQAEQILLEELELKNFKPSNEPINIKSFKESFLTTGRLDAEYYQKKYEEIIEKIKSYENGYDILDNLVYIKKSIEPGSKYYSNEGIPFLRVSDYDKFELQEPIVKLSSEFVKNNQQIINDLKPKKETILFSKDGSVGTAYLLTKNANFITSSAILHLIIKNKKKILPEYLTLILNSELIQKQAERDVGGSIILHWRVSEIKKVIIPLIDIKIQEKIANLIQKSFDLKKQSKELLETAKKAVEIAIETDEKTAIEFINEKIYY
jgi:type I restriction enzyme S subunit